MLRATSLLVTLPKCVAAEEVFSQVDDSVVQGFARIAWFERQFTRRFRAIQVPVVLGHLDCSRLDRGGEVPLFEKGIQQVCAGNGES